MTGAHTLALIAAALFSTLGLGCVLLVVISLPGIWLMLLLALGLQWAGRWWLPADAPPTFEWWTLGVAAGLAIVGEVLDFVAAAAGAKKGGASKRGVIGALIGGIVGAIVGTPVVPVLGTLVGGIAGSAAGAIVGELSHPHMTLEASLKPATGAVVGRVVGVLGKLLCAIAAWGVLTVAAFVP